METKTTTCSNGVRCTGDDEATPTAPYVLRLKAAWLDRCGEAELLDIGTSEVSRHLREAADEIEMLRSQLVAIADVPMRVMQGMPGPGQESED